MMHEERRSWGEPELLTREQYEDLRSYGVVAPKSMTRQQASKRLAELFRQHNPHFMDQEPEKGPFDGVHIPS